jgi:hypothetical protein
VTFLPISQAFQSAVASAVSVDPSSITLTPPLVGPPAAVPSSQPSQTRSPDAQPVQQQTGATRGDSGGLSGALVGGAIAGGVLLVAVGIAVVAFTVYRRRRKHAKGLVKGGNPGPEGPLDGEISGVNFMYGVSSEKGVAAAEAFKASRRAAARAAQEAAAGATSPSQSVPAATTSPIPSSRAPSTKRLVVVKTVYAPRESTESSAGAGSGGPSAAALHGPALSAQNPLASLRSLQRGSTVRSPLTSPPSLRQPQVKPTTATGTPEDGGFEMSPNPMMHTGVAPTENFHQDDV